MTRRFMTEGTAAKIEKLREDVAGIQAHIDAAVADIGDGFPCNFDYPILHFENFKEFETARAIKAKRKGGARASQDELDSSDICGEIVRSVARVLGEHSEYNPQPDGLRPADANAWWITEQSPSNHGWRISLGLELYGHMSKRTAAAESVREFMRSKGWSAGVVYRLD
jgi:hypothetical protein